jgi:hypothetical protein
MIHLRRFFTVHPLKHFDAMDVGAAILFLCTKSEDCPRRLEYIVRTWYRIRYELETVNPDNEIIIDEKTYHTFCEYITWLESIVLQTIGFNFGVEVPHPFVLKLAQQYRANDNKFMEAAFWLTTDA